MDISIRRIVSEYLIPSLVWTAAFTTYAELIISGFRQGRPISSFVFLSIFLAAALLYFYSKRSDVRYRIIGSAESFTRSFSALPKKVAWWRTEIDDVRSLILSKDDKCKVILLAGPSGAGKSVLISTFLIDELTQKGRKTTQWKVLYFLSTPLLTDDYKENVRKMFNESADTILSGHDGNGVLLEKEVLVVFDQFERFPTAYDEMTEGSEERVRELSEYIRNGLKTGKMKYLFISRKESHLDHTEFLKNSGFAPYGEFVLRGIHTKEQLAELKQRFRNILEPKGRDNPDNIDKYFANLFLEQDVRPVEAQVVGWTLEASIIPRLHRKNNFPKGLPDRRDDIVDEFFELNIEGLLNKSKKSYKELDKEVPILVLLALSHQRPLGRPLSNIEIAGITHLLVEDVNFCLKFFSRNDLGIVKNVGNNHVHEIAHDFLATEFLRFSASKLPAIDRDNIAYFSSISRIEPKKVLTPRTSVSSEKEVTFNDGLFVTMLLIIIIRILSPLYEHWIGIELSVHNNHIEAFYNSIRESIGIGWSLLDVVDVFVVPICIPTLIGASYADRLYRNLLSSINETKPMQAFSWALITASYGCGVLSLFFPLYWMSIVMIPCMICSVKLIQITRMDDVTEVAKKHVFKYCKTIMFSSFFFFLLGLYFAKYLISSIALGEDILFIYVINFIACIAIGFIFSVGWNNHVSPVAARETLGLLDRGKRGD